MQTGRARIADISSIHVSMLDNFHYFTVECVNEPVTNLITAILPLGFTGGYREGNTVFWKRSNDKWPEGAVGTIVGPTKKPDRLRIQVNDKKFSILISELRPAVPDTANVEAALAAGFTQAQIDEHIKKHGITIEEDKTDSDAAGGEKGGANDADAATEVSIFRRSALARLLTRIHFSYTEKILKEFPLSAEKRGRQCICRSHFWCHRKHCRRSIP